MVEDASEAKPSARSNANSFTSYDHDMANAAAKAGIKDCHFIQKIGDQRIGDAAVARYERA